MRNLCLYKVPRLKENVSVNPDFVHQVLYKRMPRPCSILAQLTGAAKQLCNCTLNGRNLGHSFIQVELSITVVILDNEIGLSL